MIRRVLLAAIMAGLAAGVVMGVIQHVRLTPLILHAEQFETTDGHGHDSGSAGAGVVPLPAQDVENEPQHDASAWAPKDGWERTLYTTLTAMLSSAGFALLLTGVSFLVAIPVTRGNGLLWGLCGFLAVSLAPAIGLPPELPGMPAAGLVARQAWWIGTIFCTGLAIWLVVAGTHRLSLWGATALALLPHVLGAPRPLPESSALPATLAAEFATSSLGANLVMWLLIGLFLAIALTRLEEAAKT